jgi:hypothetical protein
MALIVLLFNNILIREKQKACPLIMDRPFYFYLYLEVCELPLNAPLLMTGNQLPAVP